MLKKIIITIILVFSIFGNSLAEKITFSLNKVDVLAENILELKFNKDLKKTNFLISSFKIIDNLENQLLIEKAEIFDKNKVKIFLDKNLELDKNYKITVLELLDIEGKSIKQGYNASLEFITPKNFDILKDKNSNEKSLEFFKIEEKNIDNKNVINNKEKEINKKEEAKKDILEKIKMNNEELKKEKQKQLEKKLKEEKIIKNNITEKIKAKNKEIKNKLENNNNNNKGSENVNDNSENVIIVDSLPTAGPTETILIIISLLLGIGFFIRRKI